MSQYAMTEQTSQEDQQVSEQVAQQVQRFVQPFLEILDAYVDCRLVETFWQTIIAIIVARTSLVLSVLGEYLADPQHGPAGTKQLERLLHSAKWCSRLIEQFLWRQADQGLSKLEAAGEEPLCVWDASRAGKTRESAPGGAGSGALQQSQALTTQSARGLQ
jgi:hypothetical protein